MADFDHQTEIAVRFRDIDAMGHVNNAVFSTYTEQARVEYITDVVGGDALTVGAVLADLHIDFERPIEYGESVVVHTRVDELGSASIPVVHEVRANGERAATAEALMVGYDSEAGESRPVPEAWREEIRAHEGW